MDALEMLKALRRGPYRARGGVLALAANLTTPPTTLDSWLYGQRRPSYEAEQRIRRLWEAHGLDQETPEVSPDA